jgi:hypothetical protein
MGAPIQESPFLIIARSTQANKSNSFETWIPGLRAGPPGGRLDSFRTPLRHRSQSLAWICPDTILKANASATLTEGLAKARFRQHAGSRPLTHLSATAHRLAYPHEPRSAPTNAKARFDIKALHIVLVLPSIRCRKDFTYVLVKLDNSEKLD